MKGCRVVGELERQRERHRQARLLGVLEPTIMRRRRGLYGFMGWAELLVSAFNFTGV